MRKIIFVLLALLLTLAGCGKEALPETSSVPSEDTHITSPTEEKTEQSTVPSSEPAKTTEVPEETAVSKAESGTSDSSVKEPKQNTPSGGPTEPTEKTAPAENTSPTEPTETTPTVPNASASDAGAIAELVAERVEKDVSEITPESSFKELGIDSLDTVELLMNLEDKLDMEIELDQKVETVGDLVAFIESKRA